MASKRKKAAKLPKPRAHLLGCYQHAATQPWCEMCRIYAGLLGRIVPVRGGKRG